MKRITPAQVDSTSTLKFLEVEIASESSGVQKVQITPKEIIEAAKVCMTPEERLSLAGFSINSEGILILETSSGPRHLAPFTPPAE